MKTLKIGVLASHNGTDMRGIYNAIASGVLSGVEITVVISNNSDAPALEFARGKGIPAVHISGKSCGSDSDADELIRDTLLSHGVDVVILCGYMKKVGPKTLSTFFRRILNVHPALLPKFGGIWGDAVHKAVLESGDPITGVTIHHIDKDYDTGEIIVQSGVSVEPGDTVESLRTRVQEEEILAFIDLLKKIQEGTITL